jgi:4-amino-4-deoxy-L-arabinose transferase-like glycosyltransferase
VQRETPPFAARPVLAAVLVQVVLLSAASQGYGYHRDELYFRMLHPSWGYFDEPPLTPLLAHVFRALADQPWALRIPATVATAVSVVVIALIARELGGERGAQALAAWGYAFASVPLVMGHTLLTSSIDLPVWPAMLLFVIRAQLRGRPRWWLAAGVVAGVSTYNKLLVAVLVAALVAGVLISGPRRVLWSRHVLAGGLLALLIAAPNIAYQATHDWPQLTMGRALADHNAGDVHAQMWPFLLLMLGPPLVPIWVAGLVALARRPQWRPVRFLVPSFGVLLVLVFLMGSQLYYPLGLLAVVYAAGCVPAAAWMRTRARRGWVVAAVLVNALVSVVVALPLIPLTALGSTPVPDINQAAQDSVGWPVYVRQIAGVYRTLTPDERGQAIVFASNYGEAGAVDRYGGAYGLPAVYSGQNQLYFQGRPPDSATIAVVVGGQLDDLRGWFASCAVHARLDNGVGVDNEEQGEPVAVCRGPVGGWATVWPHTKHAD